MAAPSSMSASWAQFDDNLKSSFQEFLAEESLVDVTLITKDKRIVRAHKLILAAGCGYFRDVFLRCGVSAEAVIVLPSVSYNDLNALMQFLYTGQLDAGPEQVVSLTEVAKALNVHGLDEILNMGMTNGPSDSYADDSNDSPLPITSVVEAKISSTVDEKPPSCSSWKRRRKSSYPLPASLVSNIPSGLTIIPLNNPPSPPQLKQQQQPDPDDSEDSSSSLIMKEGQEASPDSYQDYQESEYAEGEDPPHDYLDGGSYYQSPPENMDMLLGSHMDNVTGLSGLLYQFGEVVGGADAGVGMDNSGTSSEKKALLKNQCPNCLHVFRDGSGFSKHMESSLRTGCKQRHQCSLCNCSFILIADYRKHLIKRHEVPRDSPLMLRKTKCYKFPKPLEWQV